MRYILTTFNYGTNLGPLQAARHIAGVSAHELATTSGRHVTIDKLNKAIADVFDAFTELDLIKVWGDGSVVARRTSSELPKPARSAPAVSVAAPGSGDDSRRWRVEAPHDDLAVAGLPILALLRSEPG